MTRLARWSRSHKVAAVLIIIAALAVFALAAMGTALATDQPGFCTAACHEMRPYHAAWSQGAHAEVGCVSCHVEAGIPARLSHKVAALHELWVHVAEEPTFPLTTVSPVPDARCTACHVKVVSKDPTFDHAQHATRDSCQNCHSTAGHDVPVGALKQAGILNTSPRRSTVSTRVATVDEGIANVPGHIVVSCSRCHDLAKTGCPTCHEPQHDQAGAAAKTADCQTCHAPGEKFVFVHPTDNLACASCHKQPAEHKYTQVCTTCHTGPGATWAFSHPARTAECTTCHARPAKHDSGACSTCHRSTGRSWAFTHPKSGSTCTSCHSKPSGHRSGSCSTCHRSTGRSWAFTHPTSGSSCTNCHSKPSGHRSGSCSTCHRTGVSWAFRHGTSLSCSSCHKAPSKHYGTRCASCHSPARKWSNASFSHARIRGGEHTYRSFACSNCHPSGYRSHTCSKCHKSSGGPTDD